ncbi:DsbA family oxidoreductase [Phenylobacterium sp.]|uniref:DsbA family oxidoreductase n=1 Tax=Phenylobacterium sp. TaxID=1871053 RepID=UPI002F3E8BCF
MSCELAVTVYFDLICPWCLIGKRNLETALTMLEQSDPRVTVKVEWRSTQLLPHIPEGGLDFTAFYEARLGGAAAVRARQAQVLSAAREAGCEIAFERIFKMPNTAKAHRLLHFARSAGPDRLDQLLDRLFQAHFVDGLDIGDAGVLASLAQACGYDRETMARRIEDPSLDSGWLGAAAGVPLYVFGDGAALSGAHPPATLHAQMRRAAMEQVAS